jgi:hypothetical protein
MGVVINELEVIPQQEQQTSSPQQQRGEKAAPTKPVSVHEVRKIDRHVHVRALRLWAH